MGRAKIACAEPGCPNLVERMPATLYCEAHDNLNDDLEADYEDWARGIVDQVVNSARELDGYVNENSDNPGVRLAMIAGEEILRYAPALLRAAEAGEVWTAVHHALWIGRNSGHEEHFPELAKLHRIEPDARRGRKVREAASEGGRTRRKVTSAETLDAAAREWLATYPQMTWAEVCRRVAESNGISPKTVTRYIADPRT